MIDIGGYIFRLSGEEAVAEIRKPSSLKKNASTHVIFVHGLNGDKEGSWQSSGQIKEFWPDWLQEEVDGIAVWSLGYPAAASRWQRGSAMPLPDRAANVLPTLLDETGLSSGNIVLVGYSLGGLVIEETLRLCETQSPHIDTAASFLRRVRGVAFIGTPHLGSDQASLFNALSWLLRPRETTTGLSRNDPNLRGLNIWFRAFAAKNNVEAIIFRETKPTSLFGIIVKPDSADPGLPPSAKVVPVDEDHRSICAPPNRDSEVYRGLKAFVSQSFDRPHPETLLAAGMKTLSTQVEQQTAAIQTTKDELLAGQKQLAERLPGRIENDVVSAEAERKLWRVRRARNLGGFDAKGEAIRLYDDVLQGELASTKKELRCQILAWCARILAPSDITKAKEMLHQAEALGSIDDVVIASAFLARFEHDDKDGALGLLSSLNSPAARSAALTIVGFDEDPEIGLEWFRDAGLTLSDLDPDGKFQVIHRRIQCGKWTDALFEVDSLSPSDFEQTPVLLNCAATVYLAQAIHEDLRQEPLSVLPTNPESFPLATDSEAIAFRVKATTLYEQCAAEFEKLGCDRAAGSAADYSLWLRLRNPATSNEALRELGESMSDAKLRLRRLPLAIAFGLKIDRAAAERDIDQETKLSGGKSPDAAVARFALAMTGKTPQDAVNYIRDHRPQLSEYFNPDYISAVEIEALARAGNTAEARTQIASLKSGGTPEEIVEKLSKIVEECEGEDPIHIWEQQYLESGAIADLINLVQTLVNSNSSQKLVQYGRQLFEATKDLPHATIYTDALFAEGLDEDIVRLSENFSDLFEKSDVLSTHLAWSMYRLGDLEGAERVLAKLKQSRDEPNDRYLTMNIAIVSGDWSSLGIFVETEWTHRQNRTSLELLRAGKLAHRIGAATRSQELVREAAAKSDGDPNILVGCYEAATEGGWEDSGAIHQWLETAISASGEGGPVRKVGLNELLESQPSWNQQQERSWQMLLEGTAPMFAAGKAVNQTLLSMFLLPALLNRQASDIRKRTPVFALSGARIPRPFTLGRVGLDVTSILTLAMLGLLTRFINACQGVQIAHTTLLWLFEERERLEFHQPSQVEKAKKIKRLLYSGVLRRFEGSPGPAKLVNEVGDDLARFLIAAAAVNNESGQRFVVRPYPLPKAGSLMEEMADITGYEPYLVGCQDVVQTLYEGGHITEAERTEALSYLHLHEKPWPQAPKIAAKATLFLDDLSVTFLQQVGLLERLQSAGFNVFIAPSEIEQCEALLQYESNREDAKRLVEEIRSTLASGIASGKITLSPMPKLAEDSDNTDLRQHPSVVLFGGADKVDAFIIDDRFHNQHAHIDTKAGRKPIHTTIDALLALEAAGKVSAAEVSEQFTQLRRFGFFFVPLLESQFLPTLHSASVSDGTVLETAELREIRKNLIHVRMFDALQIPKERAWMDSVRRTLTDGLRAQWNEKTPDADARPKSTWCYGLLDIRRWLHRMPEPATDKVKYRAQLSMLMLLPGASDDAQRRYWEWLEDSVLAEVREEDPETYEALVEAVKQSIYDGAERVIEGEIDD